MCVLGGCTHVVIIKRKYVNLLAILFQICLWSVRSSSPLTCSSVTVTFNVQSRFMNRDLHVQSGTVLWLDMQTLLHPVSV